MATTSALLRMSLARSSSRGYSLSSTSSSRLLTSSSSSSLFRKSNCTTTAITRHALRRNPQQELAVILGGSLSSVSAKYYYTTFCESPMIAGATQQDEDIAQIYERALQDAKTKQLALHNGKLWKRVGAHIKRGIRLVLRALKLLFTLAPVVALYPVSQLVYHRDPNQNARDIALNDSSDDAPIEGALGWYLRLCLKCVEASGAAVIKLMQWAGSRPDMFGQEFCSVFSKLQDDTTPHAWRHTERVLKEAYGEQWKDVLKVDKKDILGSGCIGQVYKGTINQDGKETPVAIKVMHPSVEDDIDADLDLMRLFVRVITRLPFLSGLKWLNMEGAVEEFADLLKLQLDCRVEAANLERFNENFKDSKNVVFPKIVEGYKPSKDVLIETFLEGVPVMKFARENRDDEQLLHEMCIVAIQNVCKMIFLDNFMHGDLHPGNVFIDPKEKKFILFDVGIVAAYTEEDHSLLVDILTAFIRRKGRDAGRLMIDGSNRLLKEAKSEDHAIDEEKFIDKIEAMNKEATSANHSMENLGVYISQICNAASQHHVLINQAFISAALAIKVQEGIAIALDSTVAIWKVAIPIIWESERQRGKVKKTFLYMLGLDGLEDKINRMFNKYGPEPTSPDS